MNLNKVILAGNVTRDPEIKSLPSGMQVTSFGLATNRFFTDKAGQKQKQAEFHNIVIFGKMADTAAKYLNKGSLVLIEGRLQTKSWQDAAGNKRNRTEIVAEKMQLGPRTTAGKMTSPEAQEAHQQEAPTTEEIPVIEEGGEIDVKDIPF